MTEHYPVSGSRARDDSAATGGKPASQKRPSCRPETPAARGDGWLDDWLDDWLPLLETEPCKVPDLTSRALDDFSGQLAQTDLPAGPQHFPNGSPGWHACNDLSENLAQLLDTALRRCRDAASGQSEEDALAELASAVRPFVMQSALGRRVLERPRGYAGDYAMM